MSNQKQVTPENVEDAFSGFPMPTKNYFPMPNNWTDISADIDSLAELKIVEYLMRHTWGFQEYGIYKTISTDEFMHGRRRQDRTRLDKGTGLSEPSVKDGIRRALLHGYIVCSIDEKDRGRTKKSYALKMQTDGASILPPKVSYPVNNLSPQGKKVTPRGQVSYPRSEKDTIETNSKKETKDTYTDVPSEIGTPSPSPFSLLLESWRTGSHEEQQATLQVLIDAGIIPPVNENDNHSHSSEKVETSSQSQNSTTIPEASPLPTQQAENASVLHETHNSTPTLENGLEVAKQEASDEICVAPTKRKSKKVLDLVPTPPPAKPLEDTPWSVEKCLAWGDYARKCVFAPSNHPQSKYYKSVEAAKKIIGQGIQENTFLSVYLNWMKGVNLNLEALPEGAICSETWPNYSVDLWVFIEHYEDEARKYKKAKLAQVFQPSTTATPIDLTTQRENARIKNLANLEKMKRIKAKLEEEKQQQAGKKRAAI